ncbi:cell surface glycoprotein [Natrinema thermotolerans DSM 11552]|nr:cell surface glycoprotein [Natrinema thermotolerans DSM 11552]
MVILAVLVGPLGTVSAATNTDSENSELTVTDTIDTPTRTVTIEGSEYTVSELTSVDQGESISVDVSTGSNTNYNVYLYNGEQQVELSESGVGPQQLTMDTAPVDPGTYALTLYIDGDYVDYLPVVISGYDVSTTHPTSVETGTENVTIDVTSTATADGTENSPAGVEVVAWNDETVIREPATHIDGETYRATISTAEFAVEETYAVYAAAQGTEQYEGEPEALGVSDGATLRVTHDDGGSDDDDSNSGTDDGSGSDETDTGDSNVDGNETDSLDGNETDSLEGNETDPLEDGNETDPLNGNETNSPDNDGSNTSESERNESVIEPTDDGNDAATDGGTDSVPVNAVPVLVSVILLGGLYGRLTSSHG